MTSADRQPVYPMTPVDCLISELRDIIAWSEPSNLLADFEARVRQFKHEVAAPADTSDPDYPSGASGAGNEPGTGAAADRQPDGAALITAERKRQIEQEGWTPEHDAGHTLGELAAAGACYALHTTRWKDASALVGGRLIRDILWPWEPEWWKPAQYPEPPYSRNTHRDKDVKDLVRAGALIAAEIDRLQRESA